MNIFVLDLNPEIAAKYHNDKHVVKMILESTQMLSNAYYDNNKKIIEPEILKSFPRLEGFYKPAHWNHPCSVWARENLDNWLWLFDLSVNLCQEYNSRYKKVHKCEQILKWMKKNIPPLTLNGLTDFAQAMPKKYNSKHIVKAYRNYYIGEKRNIAQWKNGKPWWYK